MTVYVYSTLTCDNAYAVYARSAPEQQISVIERTILIKGGTGIANKYLQTPFGVMTEVSDEDFHVLEQDPNFQLHKKNGFITVEHRQKDVEKVIEGMELKDESAPVTNDDFMEVTSPEGRKQKVYKPKGKRA